jgi:hypothetical protein
MLSACLEWARPWRDDYPDSKVYVNSEIWYLLEITNSGERVENSMNAAGQLVFHREKNI